MSATPTPSIHRAQWKPRLSILGLLGGILTGIAAVVLMQQYAILYPTREVLAGGLVSGALVGGLGVPGLFRIVAVRRYNRVAARIEPSRASAATAPKDPGPSG